MESQNTGNLANLYRPKTFKEVVGQDLAVSALKRVAHAPGITVRSILLKGSWGSGKCVHPDTIVRTADGLRKASSIVKYTPFEILGSSNAFVGAELNSETQVYCIKTERGKTVKVTGNHPIYVWDGEKFKFVRADFIKKGDCVVEDLTPMQVTSFDKWAYLVGLLLGDGVLTQNRSNTISFVTADVELCYFVESYCKSEFWHYTKQVVCIGNRLPQYIIRFNRFSTPYIKCDSLGILGHTADTKVLPEDFWTWNFSSQVSLLQGVMDTDGSCSADGSIELGLNSLSLLEGLSHVIQSLGMSVRISKRVREYDRKDGSSGISYRMYISQVTSKGSAQSLFRLRRKLDNIRSVNDISQIKRYKFKGMAKVIYNYLKDNNIHISNEDRKSLSTNFNNGEMSCYRCMQWQDYLQQRGYDFDLIHPNIYPDFVTEIAIEQVPHTIDLQCETVPVFYTSGIITHNTTVARIFGRALNCDKFQETDDVCNECPKCKDAMTRTSQLYMELDATSVGNVDAIRNLGDRLSIVPNGRRLVVIDEIHAASVAALNALLKIIEDGVPNTIFMFCLAKGTLIPTSKGIKPIELIQPGDEVHSLSGLKKVKALHVNGVRECVTLKTKSGHTLVATPDHKIQVLRQGKIVWSEIKDIKVTDCIPISVSDVMSKGQCSFSIPECELIGRIVGDGYYNGYRLGVLFNYSEWEYGKKLLESAKVDYKPVLKKSVVEVTIHNSGNLKKIWGLLPYVNGEKQIPTSVWNMDFSQVKAFLKGWRDADMGKSNKCLYIKSEKLAKQASILSMYSGETISVRRRTREVTEDARTCGVKKGIYSYSEVRSNSNKVIPFDRTLAEEILLDPPSFDWRTDTKVVDGLTKLRQRIQGRGNYNISWNLLRGNKNYDIPYANYVKVESVEYFGECEVYDLELDHPDKSFIADGFSVHNCTTEDILPTIQSRSLCIDIGTIPLNVLSARIKEIADSRNLPISDQNLSILAMKSQGHMRDALQLLQLYELAGERGLDSSYFKLRSFIINCLSSKPKMDPELILNDILRYPTADIKLSVGMFIRNIFKADQGTTDYKLLQAGFGKSLFSYFFSPLSQQALRTEVGTEILLRAFLERTKKPNH